MSVQTTAKAALKIASTNVVLMTSGCAEHRNPVSSLLRNDTRATAGPLLTPVITRQRPLLLRALIEETFVTLLLLILPPLPILQSPAPPLFTEAREA